MTVDMVMNVIDEDLINSEDTPSEVQQIAESIRDLVDPPGSETSEEARSLDNQRRFYRALKKQQLFNAREVLCRDQSGSFSNLGSCSSFTSYALSTTTLRKRKRRDYSKERELPRKKKIYCSSTCHMASDPFNLNNSPTKNEKEAQEYGSNILYDAYFPELMQAVNIQDWDSAILRVYTVDAAITVIRRKYETKIQKEQKGGKLIIFHADWYPHRQERSYGVEASLQGELLVAALEQYLLSCWGVKKLTECERIFIPVLIGDYKWILTSVCFKNREIHILDSSDISQSIEDDLKEELSDLKEAISIKYSRD